VITTPVKLESSVESAGQSGMCRSNAYWCAVGATVAWALIRLRRRRPRGRAAA